MVEDDATCHDDLWGKNQATCRPRRRRVGQKGADAGAFSEAFVDTFNGLFHIADGTVGAVAKEKVAAVTTTTIGIFSGIHTAY